MHALLLFWGWLISAFLKDQGYQDMGRREDDKGLAISDRDEPQAQGWTSKCMLKGQRAKIN